MGWIIAILTFILVLVCLFLCLLILAQKPKKDTGGGLAFGGGASDALFGAGSGDMFTKLTKYFSVSFFVLVLLLSLISAQASKRRAVDPRQKVSAAEKQDLVNPEKATTATSTSAPTGGLLSSTNVLAPATNVSAPPTNPAPKPDAEKK